MRLHPKCLLLLKLEYRVTLGAKPVKAEGLSIQPLFGINMDVYVLVSKYLWYAADLIFHFVLEYATIFLAFATAFMAFSTWRYAKLMRMDRERDNILERIHFVLNPLIRAINEDFYCIDNPGIIYEDFNRRHEFAKKFENFLNKKAKYSLSFWDIMGRYPFSKPMFKRRLRLNDDLSNKLNNFYDTFGIEFENFYGDDIRQMTKESNTLQPREYKKIVSNNTALCENYIIRQWNLDDALPIQGSDSMFLEQNIEKLNLMSQKISDKLLNDIWRIEKRLKKSDKTICKKLEKIKEKYRKKYILSEDELKRPQKTI